MRTSPPSPLSTVVERGSAATAPGPRTGDPSLSSPSPRPWRGGWGVRLALALTAVASAQTPPGSASGVAAPVLPAPSASASADSVYASCIESVPDGVRRPKLTETFPASGLAGYALPLTIEVEHGAGETVLPQGFSVQARGVEADALRKSGFMVPSPEGGARPSLTPMSTATGARTKVMIPLVALPTEPGRHAMVVPPLPLAVARASGEVMTLCTQPHVVQVDDPTGNTPDARPRPNPAPRPQREHWTALERAVQLGVVALIAAVIGALVYRWWRRRPKPVPPPPPLRPAWEVALEAMAALRDGPLLREGKRSEYVDALSDVLRQYLGVRYGFDGLEATSREVRRALRAVVPPLVVIGDVERVLDESDLVKFARVTPTAEECDALDKLGESIVRSTIPETTVRAVVEGSATAASEAGPGPGQGAA